MIDCFSSPTPASPNDNHFKLQISHYLPKNCLYFENVKSSKLLSNGYCGEPFNDIATTNSSCGRYSGQTEVGETDSGGTVKPLLSGRLGIKGVPITQICPYLRIQYKYIGL